MYKDRTSEPIRSTYLDGTPMRPPEPAPVEDRTNIHFFTRQDGVCVACGKAYDTGLSITLRSGEPGWFHWWCWLMRQRT